MQALSNEAARSILAALKTPTTGYLSAVTVRLFSNDIQPNHSTPPLSFEEATFSGYAPVTPVAWGAPYTDPLGNAVMVGGVAQFDSTGPTIQNVIQGYYLTVGAGAALRVVAAERFAAPIAMNDVGDSIIVVPSFSLPALATSLVQGG